MKLLRKALSVSYVNILLSDGKHLGLCATKTLI